jgi:hypothetical protein
MKLTDERRWWLNTFPEMGWSSGRPMLNQMKKWKAHTAALVKMGLLEHDAEYGVYRLTDAGRAVLREEERK